MTTPGLRADQVAEAFNAVPGQYIEIVDNLPSTTVITTSSSFAEVDSTNLSGSFVVPAAGLFRIRINSELRISNYGTSTYASIQFQLLIDDTIEVGGAVSNNKWFSQRSDTVNEWFELVFEDAVELTAGSHTFKLQWRVKDQDGSGATFQSNQGSYYRISAEAVTGSGAGGVIVTEMTGNSTVTLAAADTTYDIKNATINCFEGESVLVFFDGNYKQGVTDADHHFNLVIQLDDVNQRTVSRKHQSYVGSNDRFPFALCGVIENISAGQHTVAVKIITGSGQADTTGQVESCDATVVQYRGGQIPWELNGIKVLDTPRAINIVGGAMDVSDDGTSKLEVSLPEAVTASGVDVTLFSYSDTGPNDLTSTSYATLPSASFDVVIPAAGTYKIELAGSGLITGGAGGAYFRILVDDTDAIANGPWRIWSGVADANKRIPFAASTAVELTAGTHNFKLQYFVNSGVTLRTDSNQIFKASAQRISGSGAGGVLLDKRASDQAWVSSGITNTWVAVQDSVGDLTLTGNFSEGERPTISLKTFIEAVTDNSDGVFMLGVGIDGADPSYADDAVYRFRLQRTDVSIFDRFTKLWTFTWGQPLSAGSHTFKVYAQRYLDYTNSPEIKVSPGCDLDLIQYRGGLVPVKKDGVAVLDTPQSFNFVGPNTTVQNNSGEALIEFNGIAEGLEVQKLTTVSVVLAAANTTYTLVTGSITIQENENVLIVFNGNYKRIGTSIAGFSVDLRVDTVIEDRLHTIKSNTGTFQDRTSISGSAMIRGKAAGTYTVDIVAGTSGDHADTSGEVENITCYMIRYKGGYVQKENEPVLGTFSGDTVTLVAAPGASNESWLILNDGVRYRATLPLTLDLTTTGEGGREASKSAPSGIDHWFAYAIPSSVSGQWNVIGTTKSPGDGGPDDYSVWKYLHPVIRYNGTEGQPTGLIPMFVGADGWYVLEQRLVLTEIKSLVTWTAKSNINVPELPQSADQAMVNFFFQATANAAGDRSIFRWYKDTSVTEDYLFTTQQNNVSGQTSDQTECGIIRLAEGTTNRCAIAVEQITGTPGFVSARAHVLRFTDRYKRVGGDSSPKLITSGEYIYTDEFNDSSLNSVWSGGSSGDGGGSAVEGTDGLTISVGSGTVNSYYQVTLSLADFPGMHMRNWEISVHVEYTGGTPDDTSRAEIILNGVTNGANKTARIQFVKGVANTYLVAEDNGGQESKTLGGTGVNECWMRLRKYGDEIRTDYYLGANTIDVYGDGYWRQYDSAKNWQVVMPDSGSLEIPHKYNLIHLRVQNYDNQPAVSYKFSKFRFKIV